MHHLLPHIPKVAAEFQEIILLILQNSEKIFQVFLEELELFHTQMIKGLGTEDIEYMGEPKLDGLGR